MTVGFWRVFLFCFLVLGREFLGPDREFPGPNREFLGPNREFPGPMLAVLLCFSTDPVFVPRFRPRRVVEFYSLVVFSRFLYVLGREILGAGREILGASRKILGASREILGAHEKNTNKAVRVIVIDMIYIMMYIVVEW